MSAPAQPPTEGAEGAAPGGGPPGPPPNLTSNRRLQQTQAQVEEVVDIMRVNVDKVLERDQILSELDDRADALQAGASQFESSAAKLKRKYWWKNCKMMIMLGAICAIIVVVIVRRTCAKTTESTLRPLPTQKVVNVGGGGNNEASETREHSMEGLSHLVGGYHPLPEEPLLRWVVGVFNMGAVSLALILRSRKASLS
ncbi:vesicle-associated membrane protein 1 isoform X2 [Vicugna pacos]|uniref:Vesicle-associated membrane protein 1 isoform X2 n=1 Tax=Vicugna pacos TaxID=30538 RepID=A0ABM5CNV9_VICPA